MRQDYPQIPVDDAPFGRPHRIFLLSPANLAGLRGRKLLDRRRRSALAFRLREEGMPLGDVFSFISGLYFRGKLAYAQAFGKAPRGLAAAFVITTCRGLVPPDTVIRVADLEEMTTVPIEPTDSRYRDPVVRDARAIGKLAGQGCEVVLLGSIATSKYVEPLHTVLGERLVTPAEFVGRGDMSRGAD